MPQRREDLRGVKGKEEKTEKRETNRERQYMERLRQGQKARNEKRIRKRRNA